MNTRQPHIPLAKMQLFHSYDLDQTRALVAEKFCAHRLERARTDDCFEALHNHIAGRSISLNYLRYGAEVVIEPGELTSFYLLQIPIAGSAEIACGHNMVEADQTRASLLNPQHHTRMRWRAGCEKLLVQIDRVALESVAEEMIDRALPGDLVFESAVDLTRTEMRPWLKGLFGLFMAAGDGDAFNSPRSLSQTAMERQVMEGLLRLQPNNVSHRLEPVGRTILKSPQVRAALAMIREHAQDPLTIATIAAKLGVSERALQISFRAQLAITPKQALTEERLRGAYDDIRHGDPARSLREIASSWGFHHQGRFSAAYRVRFGQAPRKVRSEASREHQNPSA